jgi:hypothetical protein
MTVAQPGVGLVARARRTLDQEDRDARQRDHEARARYRHERGQLLGAISGCSTHYEQPIFLGSHRLRHVADRGVEIACSGFTDQRGGLGGLALFDEVHFLLKLLQPNFDCRAQFLRMLDLNGIVADRLRQLVQNGKDVRHRGLMGAQEFRS